MTTVAELLQPVESDLEDLLSDLRELIGAGHPILQAAAEHLFSAGGQEAQAWDRAATCQGNRWWFGTKAAAFG